MHLLVPLGILGAYFTSTALAVAAAELINACPFNVWYQVSDSENFPTSISLITANEDFYAENFDTVPGRSIQLSTSTTNFASGSPVLSFKYTVSGGTIFYDLSTVQENPFDFDGITVLLATTRDNCPTSDVSSNSQTGSGAGVVRTALLISTCSSRSAIPKSDVVSEVSRT